MSTAQHSPNDWTAARLDGEWCVYEHGPKGWVMVARGIRTEAEAKLMAASKDLLAALREARERMIGNSPAIRRLIEQTDAAITKATA